MCVTFPGVVLQTDIYMYVVIVHQHFWMSWGNCVCTVGNCCTPTLYYAPFNTNFPSHTATQLPLCSQQCNDLTGSLRDCYSSYEAVLSTHNSSNASSLLTELLAFADEINCSDPGSFQVSLAPVDMEDCTTLHC